MPRALPRGSLILRTGKRECEGTSLLTPPPLLQGNPLEALEVM